MDQGTNKQIHPSATFSCGRLEPKLARTGFFLHANTGKLFMEILVMVVKGILTKVPVVDIPAVQAFLINQMSHDAGYSLRLR